MHERHHTGESFVYASERVLCAISNCKDIYLFAIIISIIGQNILGPNNLHHYTNEQCAVLCAML